MAKAKVPNEDDRGLLLGIIGELFQEQGAPLDADASAGNLGHANVPAEQQGKRGSAQERIGHRLREHITGQQSPGLVKQEADDQEVEDQEAAFASKGGKDGIHLPSREPFTSNLDLASYQVASWVLGSRIQVICQLVDATANRVDTARDAARQHEERNI